MKKLLLLAILLVNGCYLLSMEAEKDDITKQEELTSFEQYAQLPQDIKKIIASYGLDKSLLDTAINKATTIQEAIKNIYFLKTIPGFKDKWNTMMSDPLITKKILETLINEFSSETKMIGFNQDEREDLLRQKRRTFKQIFGKNYYKQLSQTFISDPQFILLLLGTPGAIKLLQQGLWGGNSKDIANLIKAYKKKNTKNTKTLEWLQSSYEKAFGNKVDLSIKPNNKKI